MSVQAHVNGFRLPLPAAVLLQVVVAAVSVVSTVAVMRSDVGRHGKELEEIRASQASVLLKLAAVETAVSGLTQEVYYLRVRLDAHTSKVRAEAYDKKLVQPGRRQTASGRRGDPGDPVGRQRNISGLADGSASQRSHHVDRTGGIFGSSGQWATGL